MEFFNLPNTCHVYRVIPKNAFDSYTNTKNKKLFKDKVSRITWTHKLSKETINLKSDEINEIQIFKIELKVKERIDTLLEIIDKAIPYNIVFFIQFDDFAYLSTSTKHLHPANEDNAIVDWTFNCEWKNIDSIKYQLNLKKSLDAVFKDICMQISGRADLISKSLSEIVQNQQAIKKLQKEISLLKSKISNSKQFNKKVEMNLELKEKEKELTMLYVN
ncbi:MAG: DUF4391 domain-containing protein [Chitinophagales bacterium]